MGPVRNPRGPGFGGTKYYRNGIKDVRLPAGSSCGAAEPVYHHFICFVLMILNLFLLSTRRKGEVKRERPELPGIMERDV